MAGPDGIQMDAGGPPARRTPEPLLTRLEPQVARLHVGDRIPIKVRLFGDDGSLLEQPSSATINFVPEGVVERVGSELVAVALGGAAVTIDHGFGPDLGGSFLVVPDDEPIDSTTPIQIYADWIALTGEPGEVLQIHPTAYAESGIEVPFDASLRREAIEDLGGGAYRLPNYTGLVDVTWGAPGQATLNLRGGTGDFKPNSLCTSFLPLDAVLHLEVGRPILFPPVFFFEGTPPRLARASGGQWFASTDDTSPFVPAGPTYSRSSCLGGLLTYSRAPSLTFDDLPNCLIEIRPFYPWEGRHRCSYDRNNCRVDMEVEYLSRPHPATTLTFYSSPAGLPYWATHAAALRPRNGCAVDECALACCETAAIRNFTQGSADFCDANYIQAPRISCNRQDDPPSCQ